MTTEYILGNGTGNWTPRKTGNVTVEVWGAGQAGNDSTGAGGAGGGYSKKNTLAVTSGVTVAFSLGAPGTTSAQAGGDTWFSASGTVIANGGGSGTTRIGDTTFAGGASQTGFVGGLPGGSGAGGPHGTGQIGGATNGPGGGGGGGNGGGTVGVGTTNDNNGGAGGAGFAVTGGAGGTVGSQNGGVGGKGAGGGGGYGDDTTTAGNGGNGGDDYDNGGGGGGGAGHGSASARSGGFGGTPGGGGSDFFGAGGTIGRGGYSCIKITYTGTDPDRIWEVGSFSSPVIPSSWTLGSTSSTINTFTVLTQNVGIQIDMNVPIAYASMMRGDSVYPIMIGATAYSVYPDLPTAWLATSMRDVTPPIESATAILYDDNLDQVYWAENFSIDFVSPIAWTGISAIFIDAISPVSWATSVAPDRIAPLLTSAALISDPPPAISWGSVGYATLRQPTAYLSGIAPDTLPPIVWSMGFQAIEPNIQVAYNLTIAQDAQAPVGIASSDVVTSRAPVAFSASLAGDYAPPVANGASVIEDAPVTLSWSAVDLIVSGDIIAPISWASAVIADYTAAVASALVVLADNVVPASYLATSQPDRVSPITYATTALIDAAAPIATSSGIAIDAPTAVSITGVMRLDYQAPATWSLSIAAIIVDTSVPVSWAATIYADKPVPVLLTGPTWFDRAVFERTVAPDDTYITWIDGREIRKVEF